MVSSIPRPASVPASRAIVTCKPLICGPANFPKKVEWSGSYCIEADAYSFRNVGKMALRNKFLQQRLGDAVRVQTTVAVPFGAIKQMMQCHYENGRPFGIIQRALDKVASAREAGTATVDLEKNTLRICSRAAREVEIPSVMLDEFVDACVSSQMHIPCDLSGWERLRQSIAQAVSLAFTPSVFELPGSVVSPLDLPVGLLIKDQEPREYDFSVTIAADGAVNGEVRLPYSKDRGMRFAVEADCIRTTGQPKPHLGALRDTSPVVLDGADFPEQIQMQHMAFNAGPSPPKLTLEGDNLLILPRHRQAVYQRVVDAAQIVAQRMNRRQPRGWTVTGFVTPHTEAVVSDVHDESRASS